MGPELDTNMTASASPSVNGRRAHGPASGAMVLAVARLNETRQKVLDLACSAAHALATLGREGYRSKYGELKLKLPGLTGARVQTDKRV